MKKVLVAEATEAQIDWMVAKIKGFDAIAYEKARNKMLHRRDDAQPRAYSPSTSPSQAYPIIDQKKISVFSLHEKWGANVNAWTIQYGPTPLVAAMRCFIVSELGPEVEVPEEL